MFAIFSSGSITTKEAFLFVDFDSSIVFLQAFPHLSSRLAVLVLMRGNEDLHLNSNIFSNILNLCLDVLCLGVSLLYSSLICEDNYLVSII